ncbi:MAG: hypothetical protein Q8N87_00435 [bacterium]|nr:hypothetical protein [bacterium]
MAELDEKRRGEIAVALIKLQIREEESFRDVGALGKKIKRLVKEPELIALNILEDELIKFEVAVREEVFKEQKGLLELGDLLS